MKTISKNIELNDNQETMTTILECIPILETIAEHSELLAQLTKSQRIALTTAAGKISRPDKKEIKKRNKECGSIAFGCPIPFMAIRDLHLSA